MRGFRGRYAFPAGEKNRARRAGRLGQCEAFADGAWRKRLAVVAVLAAGAFVIFGALPEWLGDRPYNPVGKDDRALHHQPSKGAT